MGAGAPVPPVSTPLKNVLAQERGLIAEILFTFTHMGLMFLFSDPFFLFLFQLIYFIVNDFLQFIKRNILKIRYDEKVLLV